MMNFLDFLKNKQKTNYWMQNASPSEEDDGSMIAYWEEETKNVLGGKTFKCPKCGKYFKREDLDGAHVVMFNFKSENHPQFITPLCKTCNRSHDDKPFWVPKKNVIPAP